MNSQEPKINERETAIAWQLICLQSRIDALTSLVEMMASHQGANKEKLRKGLKEVVDACVQKRLERIEGLSPRMAAQIDLRNESPEIDQKLLNGLKFDDL